MQLNQLDLVGTQLIFLILETQWFFAHCSFTHQRISSFINCVRLFLDSWHIESNHGKNNTHRTCFWNISWHLVFFYPRENSSTLVLLAILPLEPGYSITGSENHGWFSKVHINLALILFHHFIVFRSKNHRIYQPGYDWCVCVNLPHEPCWTKWIE